MRSVNDELESLWLIPACSNGAGDALFSFPFIRKSEKHEYGTKKYITDEKRRITRLICRVVRNRSDPLIGGSGLMAPKQL